MRRFLLSPRIILSEILGIALLVLVSATVPQDGVATAAEVLHWKEKLGSLAAIGETIGIQKVVRGIPFAGLMLLATGSLSLVVAGQWKRLVSRLRRRSSTAGMMRAPFRIELERPARPGAPPPPELVTEGRWGWAGSFVFHLGLLLLILSGVYRAFFGAGAATDLMVGETLGAGASSWAAQWPGLAGRSFGLPAAIRLETLSPKLYPTGKVKSLEAVLVEGGSGETREWRVAINEPLRWGAATVYLTQEQGPAALLEWVGLSGTVERTAALLRRQGGHEYVQELALAGDIVARLRCRLPEDGSLPREIDVRLLRGRGLLWAGGIAAGEVLEFPGGERFALPEIRRWARWTGTRDEAVPMVYLALALAILGATLMILVIPVDRMKTVERRSGREIVTLALAPHRFAPLFADRFQRWVEEERE